ncbi:MAG: hypothetical protein QXZ31_03855 [Thermofilaceae archaeon]
MVEGLVKAIVYLTVVSVIATVAVYAIISLNHVSDLLDNASTMLTGLPAKRITVSSEVEKVALLFVPLLTAVGAFGVLVVYFVHRPRR